MTWDRQLYFPSEGRWGIFRPKNRKALAGCEPANLGTKGQHAASRPPKPLAQSMVIIISILFPNCACPNSSGRHENHNLKEQATFFRDIM